MFQFLNMTSLYELSGSFPLSFYIWPNKVDLIRGLLKEPSDLGLHCFQRHINWFPAQIGLVVMTVVSSSKHQRVHSVDIIFLYELMQFLYFNLYIYTHKSHICYYQIYVIYYISTCTYQNQISWCRLHFLSRDLSESQNVKNYLTLNRIATALKLWLP